MPHSRFGPALRDARVARGWRQRDLVDLLGNEFARSTVANVEAGRAAPSEQFWAALNKAVPDLAAELSAQYAATRPGKRRRTADKDQRDDADSELLGGPYVMEHLRYVYTFRESRSPEEVIETRRVRATRSGASGFGLKYTNTVTNDFRTEAEPLWGGAITSEKRLGAAQRTVYLRRFEFDRRMRRGDVHEFAMRTWIERDPEPGTDISFELTIPANLVTIQLNYLGKMKPKTVSRYGPLLDDLAQDPSKESMVIEPVGRSVYLADFDRPALGHHYGVSWAW